jgi:hypothetical protein
MSLVSSILTAVGYRIGGGLTISATSDPTQATFIQWFNETSLWITGLCAENDSDLGRTIGTITTLYPTITAATKASPCSLTAVGHGFVNNDEVVVKNVSGMSELNDKEYTFTKSTDDTGTLGVDSSAYTAYTSGGKMSKRKYSTLSANLYAPAQEGWIVEGRQRDPLTLRSEKALIEYDPVETNEPDSFYVDGSNNICFFVYPDDVYTVKIPYWVIPTAITAPGDTTPFLGLMDNVFIEALSIRYFSRDEYDTSFELKWQSFLLDRVKNVIAMRKKTSVKVST